MQRYHKIKKKALKFLILNEFYDSDPRKKSCLKEIGSYISIYGLKITLIKKSDANSIIAWIGSVSETFKDIFERKYLSVKHNLMVFNSLEVNVPFFRYVNQIARLQHPVKIPFFHVFSFKKKLSYQR